MQLTGQHILYEKNTPLKLQQLSFLEYMICFDKSQKSQYEKKMLGNLKSKESDIVTSPQYPIFKNRSIL